MDAAVFKHAIVAYMKRPDRHLPRLMEYAQKMRLEKRGRETVDILIQAMIQAMTQAMTQVMTGTMTGTMTGNMISGTSEQVSE